MGKVTYKKILINRGFSYSEKNDDWRKGLGWGNSIKVARILGSLFEVKIGKKVVFSHFINSIDHFESIIEEHDKNNHI